VVINTFPAPTAVAGVSIALRQTFRPDPQPLPILAAWPIETCQSLVPLACTNLTAITVQIPFELIPNVPGSRIPENFATLTVTTGGAEGEAIPIRPVPDNAHVVNACDAVTPPGPAECLPAVFHADGSRVTAENPGRTGETLTMHVYGLGNAETRPQTGQPPAAALAVDAMELAFDFGVDSAPDVNTFDIEALRGQATAVLSNTAVGLYRVTFQVPSPPQGLRECGGDVRSNVTVNIRRASSFDGAPICIAR
jgi:hypothetical protein